MSGESVYPWGENGWGDGIWGIQVVTTTSYAFPAFSTVKTERTSLELLDFDLSFDEHKSTWYTRWWAETKITGNEDTLALVTNVAPQADEPAATLYVEYDEDNDDRAEYRSDPIDTVGEQRVREVTGVPVSSDGQYRLLITDYGGYNDLSNINIGLIH